ncbi:MAG: glycosyltransferase family 4 protein [Desulfobulbus sp.]|jgi:glycosyltransferase involved in cell wall biosynthesis
MRYQIIMLGTSPGAKGGIASVVEIYQASPLFRQWGVCYITTRRDGHFLAKITTLLRALVRFCVLLLGRNIRLVHVHTSSRRSFFRKCLFFGLCRLFRVPYLIHLHGSEFLVFYHDESSALGKGLIRSVFGHAGGILVLSLRWADAVRVFSGPTPIHILPNPIRFSAIQPAERQGTTLLFTGRLGRRKGVFDLLEAFVSVQQQVPEARLICCGDGEVETCRNRVQQAGLSHCVDIPGWVDGAQLRQLLARADIFVLPSYDEGLPMSLLEAMAANIAVVTTPVGGIPDLIRDGDNGFLVQPGDVDALAEVLLYLLTNPEQRLAVADRAHETVQNYSAERVLGELEAIYREFGIKPRPVQ